MDYLYYVYVSLQSISITRNVASEGGSIKNRGIRFFLEEFF